MHHHHHDHSHAHSHQSSSPILLALIFANASFVIAEIIYAYLANSASLLGDGIHNLGDVLGLSLAYLANLSLKRKPSLQYSYGFKHSTILAAFINALFLLMSTALILRESFAKFISPSPIDTHIVLWFSGLGLLINAISAFALKPEAEHDLNFQSTLIHFAYDAVISAGVFVSAFIIARTQWHWLDPSLGLIIAIFMLISSVGLIRQSLRLLLQGTPHQIDASAVVRYLQSLPGVSEVHDIHIWGLSTQENALTAHLIMPETELSDAMRHEIEHELAEHFDIHHSTLQIEKSVDKEGHGCSNCFSSNSTH